MTNIAEDLKTLAVDINSVNPDKNNARRHSRRNIDAIKNSLVAFGQRRPIVVQRSGMIVEAGNGTLQAAQELGWSHIAAVVVDDDQTTAKKFAIADNRAAELAHWDARALALTLAEWEQEVSSAIGFTSNDIQGIMAQIDHSIGEAQKAVSIAIASPSISSIAMPQAEVEAVHLAYENQPNYTPPAFAKVPEVSGQAVQKADQHLRGIMMSNPKPPSPVVCPECGHEFRITTP